MSTAPRQDSGIPAGAVSANMGAWVASAVASLAYLAVSSRIFKPETVGAYSAAMLAEGLVYLILGSGLSIGMHRKAELTQADEQAYLGRSIITGIVAALLMIALAGPWSALWDSPQTEPFTRWWAAVALFHPTSLVLMGILRRRDDHRGAAITVAVAGVGSSLLGVIPVIITRDPLTLVASNVLVPVIMIATAVICGAGSVPKFPARLAGSGFVNRSTVLNVVNYISYNAMAWSVSRFISVSSLGIYSRAWLMADVPAQGLAGAAASALFPEWSNERRDARSRSLTNTLSIVPSLIALVLASISALSTLLVEVFLGARWTETIVLLGVLPICLTALAPQWLLSSNLQARGKFGTLGASRALGLATAAVFAVLTAVTSDVVTAAVGAGLVHIVAHAVDLRAAGTDGDLDRRAILVSYAQIPAACSVLWSLGLMQAAEIWRPEGVGGNLVVVGTLSAGLIWGLAVLARGQAGKRLKSQGITLFPLPRRRGRDA